MRRLIAIILAGVLALSGCAQPSTATSSTTTMTATIPTQQPQTNTETDDVGFVDLSDPGLLRYLEDNVYQELLKDLNSDSFYVENVAAVYVSKEYLEEMAYNSKSNIFFGYTLADLQEQFQGKKFVFALGENGETTVHEFMDYDETYNNVVKDVAIGSGVILLCVTVSVITAGASAPAISLIFAASAKTGTIMALQGGVFSAVTAGVVTGIQTKDMDQALKSAAIAGSKGFKWGAIGGSLVGGGIKAKALYGASRNGLSMNQAALIQMESKYPLDVIKGFRTTDQYEIAKQAGLKPKLIDGKTALVRKIDLTLIDEWGRTNLERMRQGLAALDPTGQAYELHHIGQSPDATLAVLSKAEHMQGGNNKIWHLFKESSKVLRGNVWTSQRKRFWKELAEVLASGGI